MFDTNLEKRVLKDVDAGILKVTDIFKKSEHVNLNSSSFIYSSKFFAHALLFKTRSSMEDYGQYFRKRYNRDCFFGIHSSVDDPVNNRVRKLNTMRHELDIITGRVSNKSKPYEIRFDWDLVEVEDMHNDIVREIKEGTFYTDNKVGKNMQTLENTPIYIDEEKFINRMKLQSKWKKCIDFIIVNNELL